MSRGDVRVRVKAEHGQFYALVYGRYARRLKGRRDWRFWLPEVVGLGDTPGAAITDVGRLLQALEAFADSPGFDTLEGIIDASAPKSARTGGEAAHNPNGKP